ncbi:Phosphoadenosine phosphosulfate reductase [Candidatus Nasuia deltocephalinicola]|nr:Phosphoadenosine phosphosulfate reductase [Candidatus Nasuia deltocephalinicola]
MISNLKDFNPFYIKIISLNKKIEFIFENFINIKIANNLSIEDLFLTFLFLSKKKYIEIFIINTGRLFYKNIFLINKFIKKFKIFIKIYYPNFLLINKYIKKYSLNGFYNNILLRKICCHIRKVEILNKVLIKSPVWLNGQRKFQNINRLNNYEYEYDYNRNIVKFNLLLNWKFKDIFYFVEKFNIITNSMYNENYFSIGCEPCTKILKNNYDFRSGRWWWENNLKKECGLHI